VWCVFVAENFVEINTEADISDIPECAHDDKPSAGMFGLVLSAFSRLSTVFAWFFCSFSLVFLLHCPL